VFSLKAYLEYFADIVYTHLPCKSEVVLKARNSLSYYFLALLTYVEYNSPF